MVYCKRLCLFLSLFAICLAFTCSDLAVADEQQINEALYSESLAVAENKLDKMLQVSAKDDQARLALGTVQMLRGVERFAQSLYRGGLGNRVADLKTMFALMESGDAAGSKAQSEFMPPCPNPQTVSQATAVKALSDLLADFEKAEATLAKISDPKVELKIQLGRFALDVNENGARDDSEYLWKLAGEMQSIPINAAIGTSFSFVIDRAKVHYMRSLCHSLMALDEFVLSIDGKRMIESVFPVLFPNVEGASPCLEWPKPTSGKPPMEAAEAWKAGFYAYSDYAALMTLCCRLQITQKERLPRLLSHLEASVQQSKEGLKCMRRTLNAKMESAKSEFATPDLLAQNVADGEAANVLAVLDQLEKLLAGKALIPHWRVRDGRGINLRRAILESDCFEPVLWMQGTAAVPYLEKGEMMNIDVLAMLQSLQGLFPSMPTPPANPAAPQPAPTTSDPKKAMAPTGPSTSPPVQPAIWAKQSTGPSLPMASPVRETPLREGSVTEVKTPIPPVPPMSVEKPKTKP